jgi:hypothetical protein
LALDLAGGSARAGDYAGSSVWYSSSCCYQKVVRHRRDVFYVRAGAYGYVDPYRRAYAYEAPYRRVRFSEFDYYSRYGNFGRAGCFWQEEPVRVWPGWVWGVTTTCY